MSLLYFAMNCNLVKHQIRAGVCKNILAFLNTVLQFFSATNKVSTCSRVQNPILQILSLPDREFYSPVIYIQGDTNKVGRIIES